MTFAVAAALAGMAAAGAQAQTGKAATDTDFRVSSTGDLVRLCEAAPTDTMGVAALHFCHGFAVGAFQYHQVVTAASARPRLVCVPSPPPTRNEAVAAFLDWAKRNPQQMSAPPVEGLFRFLAERYPCGT
jgi:hypothetical protein